MSQKYTKRGNSSEIYLSDISSMQFQYRIEIHILLELVYLLKAGKMIIECCLLILLLMITMIALELEENRIRSLEDSKRELQYQHSQLQQKYGSIQTRYQQLDKWYKELWEDHRRLKTDWEMTRKRGEIEGSPWTKDILNKMDNDEATKLEKELCQCLSMVVQRKAYYISTYNLLISFILGHYRRKLQRQR
jgi:predicted nuclease with TOPRIM domain